MKSNFNYDLIIAIVDQRLTTKIIDEIEKMDISGVTILQGRGRSKKGRVELIGMVIEPQRETILVLTPAKQTEFVYETILDVGNLDEPGNGLVLILEVKKLGGVSFDS